MSYQFTGAKSMDLDLIEHLVLAMLDGSSQPLFAVGYDKDRVLDLVALYAGVMLPMPNDAGFMLADEIRNQDLAPITTFDCQLTIRAKDRDGQTGQNRAWNIAKAVEAYLRPAGEVRTQATLPSGRRVISFNDVAIRPIGNDNQERYTLGVTFQALCEGD